MSINLLKQSRISNFDDTFTYSTRRVLSADELLSIKTESLSLMLPSLNYLGLEINLNATFLIASFSLVTTSDLFMLKGWYRILPNKEWKFIQGQCVGGLAKLNFTDALPAFAENVIDLRIVGQSLSPSSITLSNFRLDSVDYPVDFNKQSFSVEVGTALNSPLRIYNRSMDGLSKNIKVYPPFSGNYELDSSLIITKSGSSSEYHLTRGINIPEQVPWAAGFSSTVPTISGDRYQLALEYSGRNLTLISGCISGTWISPVIYTPDEDYLTLYWYTDGENDNTYIGLGEGRGEIEYRTSDVSPLPNFLITNWTPKLYSNTLYGSLAIDRPSRRVSSVTALPTLNANDPFWELPRQTECHEMHIVPSMVPHVLGKSRRLYVKGDGELIAGAPNQIDLKQGWEYATRAVTIGLPYREFGDINDYWCAGQYISLLGRRQTARCVKNTPAASWHNMTFSSLYDSSYWEKGRNLAIYMKGVYPHGLHFQDFVDIGYEGIQMYWVSLGSYTLAIPNQYNEWVVIFAELYPCHLEFDRYMCLYYLRVRNFWIIESKFLGAFSVGASPADEGWAVCKDVDGFWVHVGYLDRVIGKFTWDGDMLYLNQVDYAFNGICATVTQAGVWAVRNDQIYWYRDTGSELVETFTIINEEFKYLQIGGVDAQDNLWLLDRDSATVYRINFSNRVIDYDSSFAFVAAIWPHPHDRSVFLYTSYNSDSYSTSVDRVWLDDPYGYRETVCYLPEVPISDLTGVQFMGKVGSTYITPSPNDINWGNHSGGIQWQKLTNASLGLAEGMYKQFRFNLNRLSESDTSMQLSKIRIPLPLTLEDVPYGFGKDITFRSHLRYLTKVINENFDIIAWLKVNG